MNNSNSGLEELVDHATAARRLFAMAELVTDLNHHINQPLAAIAAFAEGSAQQLRSGTVDAVDLLETSERISAEALRAGDIVRRLSERVRGAELRRETVDVVVLLAEIMRSLDPAARRLEVAVFFDGGDRTQTVNCYAQGLARALGTLLLRCLETAGNQAGDERVLRVNVSAQAEPDTVEIAIGIGGDSSPAGDTPLGLLPAEAICLAAEIVVLRSLVESHGGRLAVTRGGRGLRGARLTLPVVRH